MHYLLINVEGHFKIRGGQHGNVKLAVRRLLETKIYSIGGSGLPKHRSKW